MREESGTEREVSEQREEVEALRSELESLKGGIREARDERNVAAKESSKEISEVFKLLATLSTAAAVVISAIARDMLPNAEAVGKLWWAYGFLLASLVGSLFMFLILVLNVVDKIQPEVGGVPMAKTGWFRVSFLVFFCAALFGFLGGLFFFFLFVQGSS